MAWELEGLIAHLLMLISCAGEHGCSVRELLGAIGDSLAPSGSSSQDAQNAPPDRAASEVWTWLVRRSDVSVGHGREHNHLSLPELLSLPQLHPLASNGPQAKGDEGATRAQECIQNGSNSSPEDAIRVRTSEATMWEAITGHAVDHKRVPRSEWLLLLGIASSKSEGILQGDLGRLVDQDKRSVPKRTDALVKKGYIVKRTTLIRGTKTSKMWLRSLVPPLPRESDPAEEPKADMNLSRQTLAENLDPVPWRIRWTGPDIDYKALATTIMAVAKEWDVIRVRDLKEKLGVLGMRWQMKIVSKTCRFLNSRGAIQYVAAKLENRVFKDCVKFTRDMTAEDWSIYLSTGKHPGKPARGSEHIMSDEDNGNERLSMQRAHNARLSMCPPWSMDKPLPQAIARTVQSLGDHGLSNPDIYMLTLGATFNRFLSSMTGSLSTTDLQPLHLRHLQMRNEHIRTGKVASPG
ncbi:b-block binding subunit of TFIIIC domain-containing protein [Hirsutella rhossiliensis]|uniref:B-block binding subunit of TFIIIC domain-containing protein n=1 Tax=Hirsutella rhossiliensis TaxID=111463 RepID=A0A9P8N0X2_9HYPO|nr:b-block binding subunit of TFIIIC domain-containing protein [Hirsutella rhossiliensis]KAH0964870.1 b-block binding subunit of TFIIIC domain-containing protein [Hirsutella rhossiliensis]